MRRLHAIWWLPGLALATVIALVDRRVESGDLVYFQGAAQTLLSDGWQDAYGDAALQSGPLQLFAIGIVEKLAGAIGLHPQTLLALVVEVGLTAVFLGVVARILRGRQGREILLTAAGIAFVLLGLPHGAFVDGHLSQVVIPLVWVLAALDARDGKVAAAGVLIGVSAAIETWGILGLPVLLLAALAWRAASGAVAAVLTAAALYAPFVLAGEFAMVDYEWVVSSGSLLGQVVDPGTRFGWELRAAQGAVALGIGAVAAWLLRGRDHALWVVPIVVVLSRLLLDPVLYSWYLIGFETLLLVGAAELLSSGAFRRLLDARRAPAPYTG
ncbi:MAG: hypothetical protein R3C15_13515 [Thermoleophilia bacterium]